LALVALLGGRPFPALPLWQSSPPLAVVLFSVAIDFAVAASFALSVLFSAATSLALVALLGGRPFF
jgi:hypothetical protein